MYMQRILVVSPRHCGLVFVAPLAVYTQPICHLVGAQRLVVFVFFFQSAGWARWGGREGGWRGGVDIFLKGIIAARVS